MGTVVKVDNRTSGRRRRGVGRGSVVVTVRYDGGVTEEVTLAAGDAEVCGDDELLPVVGQVIVLVCVLFRALFRAVFYFQLDLLRFFDAFFIVTSSIT